MRLTHLLEAIDRNVIHALAQRIGDTADHLLATLKQADPKHGKYLSWLAREMSNGNLADPSTATDALSQFERRSGQLESRDIFQYTFQDLTRALSALPPSKSERRTGGRDVFAESATYTVYRVTTPKSFVEYSRHTQWCTSKEDNAFTYLREFGSVYVVFQNSEGRLNKLGAIFGGPRSDRAEAVDRLLQSLGSTSRPDAPAWPLMLDVQDETIPIPSDLQDLLLPSLPRSEISEEEIENRVSYITETSQGHDLSDYKRVLSHDTGYWYALKDELFYATPIVPQETIDQLLAYSNAFAELTNMCRVHLRAFYDQANRVVVDLGVPTYDDINNPSDIKKPSEDLHPAIVSLLQSKQLVRSIEYSSYTPSSSFVLKIEEDDDADGVLNRWTDLSDEMASALHAVRPRLFMGAGGWDGKRCKFCLSASGTDRKHSKPKTDNDLAAEHQQVRERVRDRGY